MGKGLLFRVDPLFHISYHLAWSNVRVIEGSIDVRVKGFTCNHFK